MPPKKSTKGGKKKKKKAKQELVVADEYDAMDLDQLKREMGTQHAALNEVRRQRNYYLLERDAVDKFYGIVRDDVVKSEAHMRVVEHQMERMQWTHRNNIKLYLQKVLHLEYEHTHNVKAVLKESAEQSAVEEARHQEKKQQTQEEKLTLKQQLIDDESAYETEIRALKQIERKEATKLREEYEQAHASLLRQSEQRLSELKDDLELRRKMEMHEIEERKNRHINDLMDNHERAFAEMKNYYNSITRDNLTLIKSLKDELQELHVKHGENQTVMGDLSQRNERLNDPLRSAQQHVHELRVKLKNFAKDRESLRQARARLTVLETQYKSEQQEHRTLVDQYSGLERERNRLYDSFEQTVMNVHQRSNRRNQVLEKVLEEYGDVFETKKSQFGAVLRASNLDPVVLTDVTRKLDDVLSSKTEMINDLKYERAKISKSHNDLVRVYESKLASFGIPRDELRLRDMITGPSARGTGTAPADLIVV